MQVIFWIALYVSTVFLAAFLVALDTLIGAQRGEKKDVSREVVAGCLIPVINMLIAGIALAGLVARKKASRHD